MDRLEVRCKKMVRFVEHKMVFVVVRQVVREPQSIVALHALPFLIYIFDKCRDVAQQRSPHRNTDHLTLPQHDTLLCNYILPIARHIFV
ncbi:hypothetical protein AVL50_20150 [Flammeovirga sp. SJP92]|nr:hypothetical protein AVL50_20150 [Flammeovirga sp. SJP92]